MKNLIEKITFYNNVKNMGYKPHNTEDDDIKTLVENGLAISTNDGIYLLDYLPGDETTIVYHANRMWNSQNG